MADAPADADAVLTQAQAVMGAHAAHLAAVGQMSAATRAQRGITLDEGSFAALQQHAATLTHEATRLQFHVMSTRAGVRALDAQTYVGRQAQVQRVVAQAQAQGLTVTEVTAHRTVVPEGAAADDHVPAGGGAARSQPARDASAARVSHAPVPREFVVQLPGRGAVHVLEADFAPAIATREVRTPRAATRETAGRDRLAVVAHRAVIDDVLARKGLKVPYRVEVLTAATFDARFGRDHGGAKTAPGKNEVVVYVRAGARPEAVAHEAEHVYVQYAGDDRARALSQMVADHNVQDWARWSAARRAHLVAHALEVEVRTTRHELETALSAARPANVQSAAPEALRARLVDLEAQRARVLALSPEQLAQMSAGSVPMAPLLVKPPELFAPRQVVAGTGQTPLVADAPEADVARWPRVEDTPQMRLRGVVDVRQEGHIWYEAEPVTAPASGHVTEVSRGVTRSGAPCQVITIQTEAGTRAPRMVGLEAQVMVRRGQQVVLGDVVAHEGRRANRLLRVAFEDASGKRVRRVVEEQFGKEWRAAGATSRIRGAIAEEANFHATDARYGAMLLGSEEAAFAQRVAGEGAAAEGQPGAAQGGVRKAAHLPGPEEAALRAEGVHAAVRVPVQNQSGNGLDDLLFEFSGTAERPVARGVIDEVKDYEGAVGFDSFTALKAQRLKQHLEEVMKAATEAAELPPAQRAEPWMRLLTKPQLEAIADAILTRNLRVRLRLGPTTTVSVATVQALEAQLRLVGLRDSRIDSSHLSHDQITGATERMIGKKNEK